MSVFRYEQEQEEWFNEEAAVMLGISPDDVCHEDIIRIRDRGWSVTTDGHPYCLNCGCQLAKSEDEMRGRKKCGTCRIQLGSSN